MSAIVKRQELPPATGYAPLDFTRKPAKKLVSARGLILYSIVTGVIGTWLYRKRYKYCLMEEVEMRSCIIALQPLLFAERDRAFLRQLRINRDEENELMKNVPGWITGHYYSEPLYKTLPKDTLTPIPIYEFYIHTSQKDQNERRYEFMQH